MKAEEKMMLILAESGLFFANCDGEYDDSEQQFISDFIANLAKKYTVTTDIKTMLAATLNERYTLDTILSNTSELLSEFCLEEQKAILKVIQEFIRKVIEADGRIDTNEQMYFNQWKDYFSKLLN